MKLSDFTRAFADGIRRADAKHPVAVNQRSGKPFQPGIGPHTERAIIELALAAVPVGQLPVVRTEVPYPHLART